VTRTAEAAIKATQRISLSFNKVIPPIELRLFYPSEESGRRIWQKNLAEESGRRIWQKNLAEESGRKTGRETGRATRFSLSGLLCGCAE
jgi:hypothetical protein